MVHIATDTNTKPETVGLIVHGQLDLTTVGAFREGLTRATRISHAVEIHLGEVDFIDGCGLRALMDAMTRARRAGYELSIVDASWCVQHLIEITDTADCFLRLSRSRRAKLDGAVARTTMEAAGTPTLGR